MPNIIIPGKTMQTISNALSALERKQARTDERGTRDRAKAGDADSVRQTRAWDREDGRRHVPRMLPDGSDIKTLSELSAMMGTTERVAAEYALEEKGMDKALQMEAKALKAPPASDNAGIAIMLQPGIASAQGISVQVENAMKPEDFHVTLAYFGMMGDEDVVPTKQDLIGWAEEIARSFDPFFAGLGGFTRFNGDETDAIVLSVDSYSLESIREHANRMFGDHILRSHGFNPHMTIGYLDHDEVTPFLRVPPIDDVYLEYVTVAYGDEYIRIRLNKPKTEPKEDSDA